MIKMVQIAKQLNMRNVKKAFYYMKRYGIHGLLEMSMKRSAAENEYLQWFVNNRVSKSELEQQRSMKFLYAPLISVIVPTYHTPQKLLVDMIESVRSQSYSNWELCLADGSEGDAEVKAVINEYVQLDARIKCVFLEKNMGISGNTNAAFDIAQGDYVGLLDHDDFLESDALFEVVKCLQENRADVVYTDEDKVSYDGKLFMEPNFKPDFSLDLLRSCNYITHFFVVKRNLIQNIGGFRSGFDGAQDYDLIFRCVEQAGAINHIPRVLYHWRLSGQSTADRLENKTYCLEAGKHSIEEHLKREHVQGNVDYLGSAYAFYHIRYNTPGLENVSIIYSTEDLKHASGDYYLFLNPDLKEMDENSIAELVGVCSRNEVGAVGAQLISKDHRILHAGIFEDTLAHYGVYEGQMGYLGRAQLNADCDAVLTDCIMIRRDVFERIGLPFPFSLGTLKERVELSSIYCKAISEMGYFIVYNAFSKWKYQNLKYDHDMYNTKGKEFTRFGRMYEY